MPGRPRLGPFIIRAGVGLGLFALAVSIALPAALPVFHFPKPTGTINARRGFDIVNAYSLAFFDEDRTRLVIFGANGPTGRLVTRQTIAEGDIVTAFTRHPEAFPFRRKPIGLFSQDTAHIMRAMDRQGVRRLVCVSSSRRRSPCRFSWGLPLREGPPTLENSRYQTDDLCRLERVVAVTSFSEESNLLRLIMKNVIKASFSR